MWESITAYGKRGLASNAVLLLLCSCPSSLSETFFPRPWNEGGKMEGWVPSRNPACVRLLQVCCQGGDKKGLKALESVPAAQEAEGKNRRVWRQGLQMARLPSANPKPV